MLEFGPTFFWVAVNLIVLYIVLNKILFKPVTNFMDKRTESIKDAISNAEKSKADADELKEKYANQIKTAKSEAESIINEARIRAGKEYDELIGTAKRDAEAILQKAREDIEREKVQMMKGIKNQVAGLALAAASKVLEANMNTEANKALVDKFIDESGVA